MNEGELISAIQNGDKATSGEALRALAKSYTPLMHKLGKRCKALTSDDIDQLGLITVWKCARNYDASKGVKFITYFYNAMRFAVSQSSEKQVFQRDDEDGPEYDRAVPVNGYGYDPQYKLANKETVEKMLSQICARHKEYCQLFLQFGQAEATRRMGISRQLASLIPRLIAAKFKRLDDFDEHCDTDTKGETGDNG